MRYIIKPDDLVKCPTCGSPSNLRPHCETERCDWISCKKCLSYGHRNGRRWYNALTKAAS